MKNKIELIVLLLLVPVLQSVAEVDVRQQAALDVEGVLSQTSESDVPVPVITSFKLDFTQGPTSEVPNVSWAISGPFEQALLTIDGTTVYVGDTRCGEGRWRDVCSPGAHRLRLTVRQGNEEVSAECFYTALLEGDEPAVLPQIGYFYPDFYSGVEGAAPIVHWRADNITSIEIWVDARCVLVTQDAVNEFRFSQLRNAGTHIVRIMAHNVTDDVESSFAYRTEKRVESVSASAPPLQSSGAPVINEFRPDAYDASIRETPYIHWNLGGEVDSLRLTIDDTPVFIGSGNAASGRWLDVSGLNVDALRGSHEVTLSVSNGFGVATSNFTCMCFWAEPPPSPPQGCEENPWPIGENVQAYTNRSGTLVIVGEGATSNFTAAADLPWADTVDTVKSVAIPEAVTVIGDNLWAGLGEDVDVNGETVARRKEIAAGFPAEPPSGAISAEFERIDIIGGKALLGVGVYTSDTLTNQNWSVATNGIIEVPAPGKQGFYYLMSKPAAPSDAIHAPVIAPGRVDLED